MKTLRAARMLHALGMLGCSHTCVPIAYAAAVAHAHNTQGLMQPCTLSMIA